MKRSGSKHGAGRGEQDIAARVLDRKVLAARLVLLFERVWRSMLWPLAVAGMFLLTSFADLWSRLPLPGHRALLIAFAFAGLAALVPLFRISNPTRRDALRRLESVSGIAHRPASSYEDRLDRSASPEQRTLWAAHRERLARAFAKLRPGLPHPRLDRADPYALRAALLLLVTVSFLAAGPQARDRLTSAFRFTAGMPVAAFRIDAWVTPPLYTGKPPVVLADGASDQSIRSVTVPEKSLLVVRVNGGPTAHPELRLRFPDEKAPRTITASSFEAGIAEYRMTLTRNTDIEVSLGAFSAATWKFDLVADTPPEISLTEEPDATPRGALKIAFSVKDDYGVAQAEARFELADEKGEAAGRLLRPSDPASPLAPPVIPLNLPRANAKLAESKVFRDLSAHPWAGLKVKMTLYARDQAGQEGKSETYELVLPARKFTKPLAKAVVEQRRNLVRNPEARDEVAEALGALTIGAEHFIDDLVVYVGLRSAFWRLKNRHAQDAAATVVGQLWDIALRIEDGDLPEAQAALRAAQERLRKALEEGAPEAEIKRLIEELRAALQRFLAELAERARRNGNLAKMPEGLGPQQLLSSKDLEQMLRNIENLAKTGARDLAQRMLNELQGMLERLQMGAMNQNARGQQMMKMVEGLGGIITQQQKLLDDTFAEQRRRDGAPGRQGQREGRLDRQGRPDGRQPGREGQPGLDGQPGGPGQPGQPGQLGEEDLTRLGELTDRQGKIREKLDSLLEQLRSFGMRPPDQLEGAARAMREAEKALEENNLGRAAQQQTLALDRLRQGTQQVAEQVLRSLASRVGRGERGQKDPFGRPERTQGPDLGTSVKVPDEIDIQRAREILEELRRRLSEPSRPMLELDYLERLIRQF